MKTLTHFLFLAVLSLCSCAGGRPTAAPSPLPAVDREQVLALLQAESEAVVAKDIERLAGLWAEDAVVADAKHTPDSAADDAVWRGIDAVLDRYMVVVFPGNPRYAAPADVVVEINGDAATARATTRIGEEVSPGGDLWTFARREGDWVIAGLMYNLEAAQP